jgi:hypothetical protein
MRNPDAPARFGFRWRAWATPDSARPRCQAPRRKAHAAVSARFPDNEATAPATGRGSEVPLPAAHRGS